MCLGVGGHPAPRPSSRSNIEDGMNCPRCFGKGRLVGHVTIHQGKKKATTVPEIQGLCPDCFGSGQAYCCEGADIESREEAMLNACSTDVNPNGEAV